MATFEVTKEHVEVLPHPNANALELAQVGLFRSVVALGAYISGDEVLYIPEYAVLPENIIKALGLEGKLAGSNHDRVKPVLLRGELSQGLVAPLSILPEHFAEPEDGNYADILGITKWEPEIPATMAGEVHSTYNLLPWIDVENIKKFPTMFVDGESVVISEKIHGTASLFTFSANSDEVIVSSKGLGSKKLALREDASNIYWRVLREYKINRLAEAVFEFLGRDVLDRVGIFGETYGSKIQDLHYGKTNGELGFAMFDIYVSPKNGNGYWMSPELVTEIANKVEVPQVPILFSGSYDIEKVKELASGPETVSGRELHIREGVVVRPVFRAQVEAGGEKIGKFVSDDYLLRKGGTEFA